MWEDLISALNATGLPFAHFAWSSTPSALAVINNDHGVYAEDDEIALYADNKRAEVVTQGTIDYFTRDDSGVPKRDIEAALDAHNVPYRLESIQFENDTGFIHYEWVFEVLKRPPVIQ